MIFDSIKKQQYQPAFQAKFLYTDSLKSVADYAVQHGKFDKLNNARKNIASSYLQTRLRFDIIETQDGQSKILVTRYSPKKYTGIAYTLDDYEAVKTISYTANKNVLKFALEKIIKLGNNAPHNKMFKNIVIANK